MGIYLESDDVAIILTGLKDKLCLIIVGYVSVKEIVYDIFIKLCPKFSVLYMNDPNRSSSIGRNSPVENRPLIRASAVNTRYTPFNELREGSFPYFERYLIPKTVLRNMWISENARNHQGLCERIQLDYSVYQRYSKKNFDMGP
jgi:hypothetical protein